MEAGTVSTTEKGRAAQTNGATELVHRVLGAPEHGAGYFFPATARGTPLWLGALALSLGLFSVINAEWINPAAFGMVIPVAFAAGALAMIVGALWDFRAHDHFGGVAGAALGAFWLSYALLQEFYAADVAAAVGAAGFGDAFGVYLILWAALALAFTAAAWFVSMAMCAAMGLVCATFAVLGLGSFFAPGAVAGDISLAGGYVGIVAAVALWYAFTAHLVAAAAERDVMPLWRRTAVPH